MIGRTLVVGSCLMGIAFATHVADGLQASPPPATQVVQTPAGGVGQEDIAAAGANPGTPWLVTDPNGAPMAWVNLYGLYSGGDGGKMPGGLICVTDGVTTTVACLTPTGTLELRDAAGVVSLTAADIRFLHKLETGR